MTSNPTVMIVLVVLLIIASFAIGVLWTRVSSLGGGNGTGRVGNNNPIPSEEIQPDLDLLSDDDYIRGNRNAAVLLIEYSDTECPFCKRFHETAQQIVDSYDGQVAWVYRHFPLDQLHAKAREEAEASECAGILGGNDVFWAYIDEVYNETPSNDGLDLELLPVIAGRVGLDINAFNECVQGNEAAEKVKADHQSGLKAGVSGTPGNFLVNTETGEIIALRGAEPFDQVQSRIDAMLQ
jgi:protein-disulfide isomerase